MYNQPHTDIGQVLLLNANFPAGQHLNARSYTDINTNIGNSYISYSLCKILGIDPGKVTLENNLWRERPDLNALRQASERSSWIFLTMQDQLRADLADDSFENARAILNALDPHPRLIVVSLCANSFKGYDKRLAQKLSAAKRRFFDALAERSLSIGVRGHYTAEVLRSMQITNSATVGCPSYFESGPERVVDNPMARIDKPGFGTTGSFRLSFPAPHHLYMQGDSEWPWIRFLCAPDDMWRQECGAESIAPSVTYGQMQAARHQSLHFFSDFTAWKQHIRDHCRLVCGTRLHGAIMALNAGVPAIVTNRDARAQESCEFFSIPWRPNFMRVKPTEDMLLDAANPDKLNALYQQRRESFSGWLAGLGLQVMDTQPQRAPAAWTATDWATQKQRLVEIALVQHASSQSKVARNGLSQALSQITIPLEFHANQLMQRLGEWRRATARSRV